MRLNPKQISSIMRQFGMQMKTIDANEVIIKTNDRKIIIRNPEVAKIRMAGKDIFQISGNIEEKVIIKDDDVKFVAKTANVSYEEARKALEETNDIAEAISKLKK